MPPGLEGAGGTSGCHRFAQSMLLPAQGVASPLLPRRTTSLRGVTVMWRGGQAGRGLLRSCAHGSAGPHAATASSLLSTIRALGSLNSDDSWHGARAARPRAWRSWRRSRGTPRRRASGGACPPRWLRCAARCRPPCAPGRPLRLCRPTYIYSPTHVPTCIPTNIFLHTHIHIHMYYNYDNYGGEGPPCFPLRAARAVLRHMLLSLRFKLCRHSLS